MGRRVRTTAVLGLVLAALVAVATGGGGEAMASGVTRDAIRSVRIGMTEAEVVDVLGVPLDASVDRARDVKTLAYTRPVRARWYSMLWVHLENGRVSEVYAKRYVWWGLDDEGVYGANDERQWEARRFETTFRR